MTKQSWSALLAVAVIVGGTSLQGHIRVLSLVDESDPIILSEPEFDATDPLLPAISVQLENTTLQPISTDRIWLSFLRFYTPDEATQNKDRTLWKCGLLARANHDQPKQRQVIPPGTSVRVRMSLDGAGCTLNPQHEHFSATVERITPEGREFINTMWKREPADHARLLQAAMLKAH